MFDLFADDILTMIDSPQKDAKATRHLYLDTTGLFCTKFVDMYVVRRSCPLNLRPVNKENAPFVMCIQIN